MIYLIIQNHKHIKEKQNNAEKHNNGYLGSYFQLHKPTTLIRIIYLLKGLPNE